MAPVARTEILLKIGFYQVEMAEQKPEQKTEKKADEAV